MGLSRIESESTPFSFSLKISARCCILRPHCIDLQPNTKHEVLSSKYLLMEKELKEKDLYEAPAAKVVDVMCEGVMVDSPKFTGFGEELTW